MKAIDLLLTLEGHRIINGKKYFTNTALKDTWFVFSGKLEPILYYYTFRNEHKISCKPDVILMSIRGKFKFLWKIEV